MGQAFLHGNGGVANGCTLTVNAPAGVTVTITKGSKTKTKTADSSGYATFKGLEQGEWTVTISSGSQTAKKTVYIVTEYDAAITFFSAAINVSYPAGSILTCTDGSTTLTAGDTAGGWYFTIPNAGNWTVTATSGSNSASQTVSITADGQAEQVVLSYTTYLYNKGWVGVATSLTAVSADQTGNINGTDKANIVITYVDECIKLYRGSYDGAAWAYTDVEIDLTNVDTIFCKTLSASSDSILFGAGKTNSLHPEASVALVANTLQSVDVSSLSGSYRIGFWGATSGYTPWGANHMIEAFGLGTGS